VRTSLQSWEDNRTPLSWTFGRLITGDALVLAISDGLMVLTMFLCVPFVKVCRNVITKGQALQHRVFSYYYTGLIIQHMFQAVYLGIAIWWGYYRDWYWVQAGFLVLHCLSMLMKVGVEIPD
jgi:sterol O-acyltransferase